MESVADQLDRDLHDQIAQLSPADRIALAFRVHHRSVEAYASLHGVTEARARRFFAAQRQRGRTPSACMADRLE